MLILGPVGGSSDVFSFLTVFEWLPEHSCVQLVPRAQPSRVHSHYTLTAFDPSFGTVPQHCLIFRAKIEFGSARLSFICWKVVVILPFACVWL